MRVLTVVPVVALLLAGCGAQPPPPTTATLPPGLFGPADQDLAAIQYAQFTFADASRTYGKPVDGAEAVLAMDYIAGALNTNPRWNTVSSTTQAELLQARADTRAAVGIAPDAPSQLVVDSLVAARNDLASNNAAAAVVVLTNPAFPAGGAQTIQVLANLPYIRMADVATQHLGEELNGPDNSGGSTQPNIGNGFLPP